MPGLAHLPIQRLWCVTFVLTNLKATPQKPGWDVQLNCRWHRGGQQAWQWWGKRAGPSMLTRTSGCPSLSSLATAVDTGRSKAWTWCQQATAVSTGIEIGTKQQQYSSTKASVGFTYSGPSQRSRSIEAIANGRRYKERPSRSSGAVRRYIPNLRTLHSTEVCVEEAHKAS